MRSRPQAGASDSAAARTARAPRTTSSRPTVFVAAGSPVLDRDAAAGRGPCRAPGLDGPVEAALLLQDPAEVLAGRRIRLHREVLGRAIRDHETTLVSTLGTEVDDPVRGLEHI